MIARTSLSPMLRRVSTVLVAAMALGACNTVGPSAVESARQPYNQAIVKTQNEQMLLNLVRLKYRDTPMFLEIGTVSTQYQFEYGGGVSTEFVFDDALSDHSINAKGSFKFIEKPTITYSPLQGEKFVTQLMTPIALDTLLLLSRSGWSGERVLRCCVQSMNGLPNAPMAAGPTPAGEPRFRDFKKATSLMRELQLAGAARLTRSGSEYLYTFDGDELAAGRDLQSVLGLDSGREHYSLIVSDAWNENTISLYPRSFLGVMFYLSQAVEVPTSHVEAGLVTQTKTTAGGDFDWKELTGDLFAVKSASSEPNDAFVRIYYRGQWFYIDDADLNSKTTFGLLSYLFSLQSGSRQTITPALTLPLG